LRQLANWMVWFHSLKTWGATQWPSRRPTRLEIHMLKHAETLKHLKNQNVPTVLVMSEAQIEVWSVFFPVRFHFCYKNIFEIENFFLAYLHRGGHNSTKELLPFGSMHWNMSCISKDHTVIAMAKHHHFRKFTQYHTWCWWNKKCFQGPHSQNHRDVRTKLVKKNMATLK
jgi:hypothetical protein